ncbi:ABC transporter ATP-binding protein [Plebeiibacterium sediminum]|uniref:ABC transporter ATP-binding protein n=1 Tax=Plebeiibacterium sediminum TaxID=2992112 RepID=A0AAE3M612_9BACT|nr:ABC transporter ATP-binding protein [Plebeiobacterium sediminum]MCW3787829.1 ABC transporter ATP-binding protein [Plebeiobacterium sediminum]
MIQAVDISKEYRTGNVMHQALSNINLNVERGDYVTFYGPSGSGKSSLVNILGLLDYPSSGELIFDGQSVVNMNERQRLMYRRGRIGYLFSSSRLVEELTVYENIELPLVYQKIKKTDRKQRVLKIISELNLTHRKNYFPKDLTGVEKQKVAIARAIIIEPLVIIADEPTGKLNSAEGVEILDILNRINENGTTIMVFTHSESVAAKGQKIVQVFDGHLVREKMLK